VNTPKRLGIDVQTLQYLDLSVSDLSENALDKKRQPSTHWLGLYNTLMGKKKRDKDDEWTSEQWDFYSCYLREKHKELGDGPDGEEFQIYGFLETKGLN